MEAFPREDDVEDVEGTEVDASRASWSVLRVTRRDTKLWTAPNAPLTRMAQAPIEYRKIAPKDVQLFSVFLRMIGKEEA